MFSVRILRRGMKGGIDEQKQTIALFPGLHINDADQGGHQAPPSNKMALYDEYNVTSQSSEFGPVSRTLLPVLYGNKGCGSFASQASTSNVAGTKRKLIPVFNSMIESPHSTERHYSYCSGSSTSLRNLEPWMSGPGNYESPSSSTSLIMKGKCISVQPRGFSSYNRDEFDFGVPSFLQSGKTLSYGNLQLHPNKEKVAMFSSVSSGKLHSACLKLPKEIKSEDQTMEHHGDHGEEDSKLSQNNEDPLSKVSEMGTGAIQPNKHNNNILGDEMSRSSFPCLECKILQKGKTVADGVSAMPERVTRKGDGYEQTKNDSIKECANGKACVALEVGNAIKKEEIPDTSMEGPILGVDLTPDEVTRVIGQRLFKRARKIIVCQQKTFSLQLFELHRLIMVQRLVARSPEIFHDNNFYPDKPSIKFPPMNKLLYVSPLDPSPSVSKPKVDILKSNPGTDCVLPLPTTNVEKGHLAHQLPPKLLPNPPSIPVDPKLAPWCFHPPPGNQWLVPVRSPSEGLIYKPYTGPCFPPVGFMAPVCGNCGPINLSSSDGSNYGVQPPHKHGSGNFYGTELSQSYFQTHTPPLINASGLTPEVKQMISSDGVQVDKNSSTGDSKLVSIQQSAMASDSGGNLHRTKESDGSEECALSLFPTTPSPHVSKDQRNDQRVQVIKVVPHNRKSAPASARRIFQWIQDERKKHE